MAGAPQGSAGPLDAGRWAVVGRQVAGVWLRLRSVDRWQAGEGQGCRTTRKMQRVAYERHLVRLIERQGLSDEAWPLAALGGCWARLADGLHLPCDARLDWHSAGPADVPGTDGVSAPPLPSLPLCRTGQLGPAQGFSESTWHSDWFWLWRFLGPRVRAEEMGSLGQGVGWERIAAGSSEFVAWGGQACICSNPLVRVSRHGMHNLKVDSGSGGAVGDILVCAACQAGRVPRLIGVIYGKGEVGLAYWRLFPGSLASSILPGFSGSLA
mmetsp:Transcript_27128/g.56373  ORF Transcript_27128/g.56373 Transcript_27128/m.56373 type:complete len:268 (+) Transcript_27128:881-1684(+)